MLRSLVRGGLLQPHRSICIRSLVYPVFCSSFSTSRPLYGSSTAAGQKSEPLRILFCGSDLFSSAHLKALHQEHLHNPELIDSLDVVVRPGKLVGRGYHEIKHSPVEALANQLALPIHLRDTFTGWDMPAYINLIIAVSFGLFVPPRLLRQARYGGLNVHPSLLPDLRGAAPLIHTLLLRRTFTGVTLQTLSPKAFDHGMVLAQTPLTHPIPVPEDCSLPELYERVTPAATQMLIQGLRAGVHVPPLQDRGWTSQSSDKEGPTHEVLSQLRQLKDAPKIKTIDRQLISPPHNLHDFKTWYFDAATRQRVIGPLWFKARLSKNGVSQRIIVQEAGSKHDEEASHVPETQGAGEDLPDKARGVFYNVTFGTLPIICQDAAGLESERQMPFFVTDQDDSVYLFEDTEDTQRRIDTTGSPTIRVGPTFELRRLKLEGKDVQPAKQVLKRLQYKQWQPRDGQTLQVAVVA